LAIILANGVGVYAMFSPQAAYFAELFDTRVRYSGLAIAREVSAPFAGGIAPFIATFLLSRTDSYWPIALYMIVLALITVVAILLGPETYQREISPEKVDEEAVRPEETTSPA
jgi:MFS family permease